MPVSDHAAKLIKLEQEPNLLAAAGLGGSVVLAVGHCSHARGTSPFCHDVTVHLSILMPFDLLTLTLVPFYYSCHIE